MDNVTITHRAGTTWSEEKLQRVWNKFVKRGIEIIKDYHAG